MNISLSACSALPIAEPQNSRRRPAARGLLFLALALFFSIGNALGQNELWTRHLGAEPDNRFRTFDLHIVNNTEESVTFTVNSASCCDSPLVGAISELVPPGGTTKIWIARVQGNGCDGENGWFDITPDKFGGEPQHFTFDNAGWISAWDWPTRYHSSISSKSGIDGSYTWTMLPAEVRLKAPVDERLTLPRNYVAFDSGRWNLEAPPVVQDFRFTPVGNTWGNFYDDCVGYELFHPQHVVRLPNKEGSAYFMLAQSRAHNGYIQVLKTYPGILDPETDLLRWTSRDTRVGEYVWMDLYTGVFNGTLNPIGNWNHPGKMELVGNVLAVSVQNWAENAPCFYGAGTSDDAVLFYDVRDPEKPVYWGKLTAQELGIFAIDGMALFRDPSTDDYKLWITGDRNSQGRKFVAWSAPSIAPRIEDWTRLPTNGEAKQHGTFFNSYQNKPGFAITNEERIVYFDTEDEPDDDDLRAFKFTDYSDRSSAHLKLWLPGADRHWVSDSLYVTRKGVPVIYSMESDDHFGTDGILYQAYETESPHTFPQSAVVTNSNDSGPGSLREAIALGGKVTFDPSLSGAIITLSSGPLVVYMRDVEIDASALENGITIAATESTAFQIVSRMNVVMRNLDIQHVGNGDIRNTNHNRAAIIVELGTLEMHDSSIRNWPNLALLQMDHGKFNLTPNSVLLQNCTIAGNAGAIQTNGNRNTAVMALRHCTIANNESAISQNGSWQNLTIENSIIADNDSNSVHGGFIAKGRNVLMETSGAAYPTEDGGPNPYTLIDLKGQSITQDPFLLEEDLHGPAPFTIRLLPSSSAIGAALPSDVTKDQLGRERSPSTPTLGALESEVTSIVSNSNPDHFSLQGEELVWGAFAGASFEVFLDDGTGSVSLGTTTNSSIEIPGTLEPKTTYAWRVDTTVGARTYIGVPQTFTTRGILIVTTLKDEDDPASRVGEGDSLREALKFALPGELITFASHLSGGTILVRDQPMEISQSVTVDASALADQVMLIPNGSFRPITVSSDNTVTLRNLHLTGGTSSQGGGLLNDGGNVTLMRCTLSNNDSSGNGGAIANIGGGTLVAMDGTIFESNEAVEGGGIFNADGGTLDINGATFLRNNATLGGGIANRGLSLTVKVATFSGNGAVQGGGVFNAGSGLFENCTFSGNGSLLGEGGGIFNAQGADLTLRHCTLADNVGTGVFNQAAAALTLDNTVVANNSDNDNQALDLDGDFTAIGANLVRVVNGSLLSGDEPLTSDPLLSPLRSGVLTPLVGSPVIDAGVVTANTPSIDQVRASRPHGAAPDIGAVESRLSGDATLDWLTMSTSSISPAFLGSISEYSSVTSDEVAAVRVAVSRGGQTVEVRINDGEFAPLPSISFGSPGASADLPLNPGENTIEVKVTAQNGTTSKTYTLTVFRGAATSGNSGLASLTTDAGALSPTFDPATEFYFGSVPNATTTTSVTPTAAQAGSTIEVRGNFGAFVPVESGSESAAIPLNVGANTIDVRVIGEGDSIAASHTLIINRDSPAASSTALTSLTPDTGSLSPAFVSGNAFYQIDASDSPTIQFTPVKAQAGGTIRVRANEDAFADLASGSASQPLPLNAGVNIIEVEVASTDGATFTYVISVTRTPSVLEELTESGNASSKNAVVSADGRFVAFSSMATNLVPGATNSQSQIMVRDRTTGTIVLASANADGEQGNNDSFNPSISGDGRYVAFDSESTNLVPGDRNGQTDKSQGRDIFVYDMVANTIERASLTQSGDEANQHSDKPSISHDGRYVAFQSSANNLIPGFRSGNVNVYVRDRVEGTLAGIAVPFSDFQSNRASLNAAISGDGNYVAFEFNVSKNDGNRSYRHTDIFLYNRITLAVERITGAKVGLDADGDRSENPSISEDGRYVAFESNLPSLDFHDLNTVYDVFVYDRVTGFTRRVSSNGQTDTELFRRSNNAAISGDGTFVAFDSQASTLVPGDTNDGRDIFVKNLTTGNLELVSAKVGGGGEFTAPTISQDGRVTGFQSNSNIFALAKDEPVVNPSADLALLTTSLGPPDFGFSPRITTYQLDAPADTPSLHLRSIPADPGATMEIQVNSGGYNSLESNAPSPALPLALGENVIQIKTIAPGGTIESLYTFTVHRARSTNADLANLELASEGLVELSPPFSAGTTTYTATVSNNIVALVATPSAFHPSATTTVNGAAVASGVNAESMALNVGANVITTVVTAEDGTTQKTYTTTVMRLPSSNANLTSLIPNVELESGGISLGTNAISHSFTVPNATATLTLTPTVSDLTATLSINGNALASGSTSEDIPLDVGPNTIEITVTAEDGTVKTYTLTVDRVPDFGGDEEIDILDVTYLPGVSPKLRITWQSQEGVVYVVEQSADLDLWEILGGDHPGEPAATAAELPISPTPGEGQFFRVREK